MAGKTPNTKISLVVYHSPSCIPKIGPAITRNHELAVLIEVVQDAGKKILIIDHRSTTIEAEKVWRESPKGGKKDEDFLRVINQGPVTFIIVNTEKGKEIILRFPEPGAEENETFALICQKTFAVV